MLHELQAKLNDIIILHEPVLIKNTKQQKHAFIGKIIPRLVASTISKIVLKKC